jgi:hypothetical protein
MSVQSDQAQYCWLVFILKNDMLDARLNRFFCDLDETGR